MHDMHCTCALTLTEVVIQRLLTAAAAADMHACHAAGYMRRNKMTAGEVIAITRRPDGQLVCTPAFCIQMCVTSFALHVLGQHISLAYHSGLHNRKPLQKHP